MMQRLKFEEKNVCQFDRMFGVRNSELFFLFSQDKTLDLLSLKQENLFNFPQYDRYRSQNLKAIQFNLILTNRKYNNDHQEWFCAAGKVSEELKIAYD
jgi:hypothetical protein